MHYKNGREARVGDLVRGKGYNVKYEIVGILVSAHPQSTACNCTVAHVGPSSAPIAKGWQKDGKFIFPIDAAAEVIPQFFQSSTEYGQLDAFVAIDPDTGEVLPPEVPDSSKV